MPYTDSAVETALEKVRELLRPDGGAIVLAESAGNGTATDATAVDPAADRAASDATASDRTAADPETDRTAADPAADNALKLRLVVENSDCPECILPVGMLEPIALDIMSADLPGLTSVSISDPRAEEDRHV